MSKEQEIKNSLEIKLYLHCSLCLKEWETAASGVSRGEYQQLEVGWTELGIQVWCKTHDCNIIHINFQDHQHPVNLTRKLTETEKKRKKFKLLK